MRMNTPAAVIIPAGICHHCCLLVFFLEWPTVSGFIFSGRVGYPICRTYFLCMWRVRDFLRRCLFAAGTDHRGSPQ